MGPEVIRVVLIAEDVIVIGLYGYLTLQLAIRHGHWQGFTSGRVGIGAGIIALLALSIVVEATTWGQPVGAREILQQFAAAALTYGWADIRNERVVPAEALRPGQREGEDHDPSGGGVGGGVGGGKSGGTGEIPRARNWRSS
jgi:hypothetical protein